MPPSAPSGNSSCGKSSARLASDDEKAADLLQRGIVDAVLLDPPGLVDQLPHGRGALLMQVHWVLRWPQYSRLLALSGLLSRSSRVNLRWGDETDRSGRPAGSSDDACRHRRWRRPRPSRRQARARHQAGRGDRPPGGAAAGAPSHHRPAPAGLRAAAGGDRARRNRRHPRPAHGARQRHPRDLPPHLPGAGRRPVRPGRR